MNNRILTQIRKLNWVLSESTVGRLSYSDLSKTLSEIVDANVLITDRQGIVIGAGYTNAEDASTIEDEVGNEKLTEFHTNTFLSIDKTIENLTGEESRPILGENYEHTDKYHCIVPIVCGGLRMGTLVIAKYGEKFDEVDIAICEFGATVVGIEIARNQSLQSEADKRLMDTVDMALSKLSYSEKMCVNKIFDVFEEDEGLLVVSKVAAEYNLTNSVIVNALRKLESGGVLVSTSLGMKGTRIKIINPFFREKVKNIVI